MDGKHKQVKRRANLLRTRLRMSQIELLAAMAEAPTLTAAAATINLSQPAASRLLHALEQDLEMRLFERDRRSLIPTAAGARLVRKAREIVAEFDRTQREMEAINSGVSGVVSVGVSVSASYALLPEAIVRLHTGEPQISVNVHEGSMEELVRYLDEGRLDLIVGRFDGMKALGEVEIEALHDPKATIVCGPLHPILQHPSPGWETVLEQAWILPEDGTPMREAVEALFRSRDTRPRSWIESSAIPVNISLLGRVELLWVLSRDVAEHFRDLGALAIVSGLDLGNPGAFALAYSKRRALSSAAQRMREMLHCAVAPWAGSQRGPEVLP